MLSPAFKLQKLVHFSIFPFYVTAPNFVPSKLTSISTSSTSMTVNWSLPSTPPPPDADGYVIYYASSSGPGMSVKIMGGSVNEHTLEDLTPATSYTISIRAYQDILGPASETIIVMTNASEGTKCGYTCSHIYIYIIRTFPSKKNVCTKTNIGATIGVLVHDPESNCVINHVYKIAAIQTVGSSSSCSADVLPMNVHVSALSTHRHIPCTF